MTEAVPPLSFPPGSGGFNAAGHMGLLGTAGLTPALHAQPFAAGNLPFMYGPPAQMMFHSIPQHVGAVSCRCALLLQRHSRSTNPPTLAAPCQVSLSIAT